jgi:hypothetical protein
MADLLDIAPSTAVASVTIDELRIKVRGVSVDAIASIVSRFPALKSLSTASDSGDLVPRLIAGCGAAVGPIIAAGCGHRDEEVYEQRAAALLPEQQIKLLRAIFGLTFPNGIGSFVEELTALIGGAGEGAKTIKIRLKKSPSPLPPSSDADSRLTMQ